MVYEGMVMPDYLIYGRCVRCGGDHDLDDCRVTPDACKQAAEWVLGLTQVGSSTEVVPFERVAEGLLAQAARVTAYDQRVHA